MGYWRFRPPGVHGEFLALNQSLRGGACPPYTPKFINLGVTRGARYLCLTLHGGVRIHCITSQAVGTLSASRILVCPEWDTTNFEHVILHWPHARMQDLTENYSTISFLHNFAARLQMSCPSETFLNRFKNKNVGPEALHHAMLPFAAQPQEWPFRICLGHQGCSFHVR